MARAAAKADRGETPTTSDVSQVHPDLVPLLPDYKEIRDCRAGASTVKREGEVYLPMPSGFRGQSDGGTLMYSAYRTRAQFPEIFSPTVLGMVGIIHRREAQIEGLDEGTPLAGLWEAASPDGLPLESLHRRITEEILTLGRVGLLADLPREGGDTPWIALYRGESIINWSSERDLFVLKESLRTRTGFTWNTEDVYRVLQVTDEKYTQELLTSSGLSADGNESALVGEGGEPAATVPVARGGKPLKAIPFVVAGSRDLSLEPDEMPLIGVARATLAIYRLDADYRHQLYMSGQETLFTFGLASTDVPDYVGAGVVVSVPADGDAKYVGPSGTGIEAHKVAIADERENAAAAGARVFDSGRKSAESGEALRIRARATTATLVSVALASAAALEQALRHCAAFVGLDPETIVVTPNLDFVDAKLTPQEAKDLMQLWMDGAISYETLYENLQRGEIASQERTAEEEQELAAMEQAAAMAEAEGALDTETDPETDPDFGQDETPELTEEELLAVFDPELLADVE